MTNTSTYQGTWTLVNDALDREGYLGVLEVLASELVKDIKRRSADDESYRELSRLVCEAKTLAAKKSL